MRNVLMSASEQATQAIEGTLSEAEKRSRLLADRMRGGIAGSLADVEKVLADAADKSDATAEHMRDSLRRSVEEAVQRFAGATDEIRRASSDIRRELDDTRSELKRGAFDLPEEAKESAAAMRRAVSEQIKALQDISALVGRSSQSLEVSRPTTPSARVTTTAPAPALARRLHPCPPHRALR